MHLVYVCQVTDLVHSYVCSEESCGGHSSDIKAANRFCLG